MMLTSSLNVQAVRRLRERDFAEFPSHLLRLDRASRRSRYGYTISDETVRAHTERCRARNAIIYAYFEDGMIRGAGELHLARCDDDSSEPGRGAELAFSVELDWRRRGIGTALAERLVRAARNRYVEPLTLSCSPDNDAMLALARKCQARLTYTGYGVRGCLPTAVPSIWSRVHGMATSGFESAGRVAAAAHDGADARLARGASRLSPGFTAWAACHATGS